MAKVQMNLPIIQVLVHAVLLLKAERILQNQKGKKKPEEEGDECEFQGQHEGLPVQGRQM